MAVQLADAGWGHPQDIMERKGGIMWSRRWLVYREQLARVERMMGKK